MGPTVQPASAYTPQGQATASLGNALNQIQGLPQSSPVGATQANAQAFSQAEPGAVQQATAQLTNESGIPALQNSQNNLGQIFQMYLADQNLSQKYSSPQLSSGTSPVYGSGLQNEVQNLPGLTPGNQTLGTNPYLASPQAIIDALMQPQGQGFQGFTTPTQDTSAIGVVPASASGLSSELSSLIGSEQGLVNTQVGNYETAYDSENTLLNNLASIEAQRAQTQTTSGPGGFAPGSSQALGYTMDQIKDELGTNATYADLWNYLNTHQTELTEQLGQSTMNQLWAQEKQEAQQYGNDSNLQSGKVPKSTTDSVAPIQSTAKGVTTTTGWKVKLSNNQTINVTPPQSTGGLTPGNAINALLTGNYGQLVGGQATQPTFSVDEIMQEAQSEGLSPTQIVSALKNAGYTVN